MSGYSAYQDQDADAVEALAVQGARLVDVRSDAEVAQGMIAGASHIPMHLLPLRAGELPRDIPVVFYCRTGARSAQACMYFAQQGHANLHNLAGGIVGWARAGKSIVLPDRRAA